MQLLERAREILKKKKDREVPSTEYLATLSQVDRERVGSLVAAFQKNAPDFWGEKIGIIAVGSSVRPEELRSHPVQDIDLRIMNSSPENTQMRVKLIHSAVAVVHDFAEQEGAEFKIFEFTVRKTPNFLDYNNNDPSFLVNANDGSLPLHVSISGPGEYNLQRHLQEERRQKQYFSVLAIIPAGK